MALKLQRVKSEVTPHFFNRDEVEALLDGQARQSHISDERIKCQHSERGKIEFVEYEQAGSTKDYRTVLSAA